MSCRTTVLGCARPTLLAGSEVASRPTAPLPMMLSKIQPPVQNHFVFIYTHPFLATSNPQAVHCSYHYLSSRDSSQAAAWMHFPSISRSPRLPTLHSLHYAGSVWPISGRLRADCFCVDSLCKYVEEMQRRIAYRYERSDVW